MTLNYKEGSWFAVPLMHGGFATGVVARATTEGRIILCYFFGPQRRSLPILPDVKSLKATEAIRAARISDLFLFQGKWPIIGCSERWNRSEWPMPVFVRREPNGTRAWRVYYSDTNPSTLVREEPAPYDTDLPLDLTLSGRGVEIRLARLLSGEAEQPSQSEFHSVSSQAKSPVGIVIEGGPFRVEVLQQLHNMGSDTSRPHSFDFYLYLPSELAAKAATEKVRDSKLLIHAQVGSNISGEKWLCRVTTTLVPEVAPLDEIGKFFEQVATALQGDFDGWESDVIKK